MVNGPPTPPATTPAELRDEGRAPPAQPQPTQSVATLRPETLRIVKVFSDLVVRRDYARFVRAAEDVDINGTIDSRPADRLVIILPLVLGYLIVDDLPPARYALLSLPDNLGALPLPKALLSLVVSTLNREHALVYTQGEKFLGLATQSDIDKDFGSLLASLLTIFIDSFRQRTFALLSKAFTSIPLSLAASYLGLSGDELISVADKSGWLHNADSQILSPKQGSELRRQESGVSSLTSFHFVADSVAQLEL